MSEVKRYTFKGAAGYYVYAGDFDRVTAERDAALGREAALLLQCGGMQMTIDELQQRLTAADERADVLEGLVGEVLDAIGREPLDLDAVLRLRARMRAALKPAERGGDHVKHYECIGKGGDYTVVAIAQGAGTLKGFNHYVYKNADGVHFVRDPEDFLSRMQIKP